MTQLSRIRRNAPSYFEYAARLRVTAAAPVIYGPHLDAHDLVDPMNMARRFAHAMARETGEPFAWGWYDSPEGIRPGVCAAAAADLWLRVEGETGHGQG